MYPEAQGLVEVGLSAILDPFGFNQFMPCPWAMSFFQRLCPGPSPVSEVFFFLDILTYTIILVSGIHHNDSIFAYIVK